MLNGVNSSRDFSASLHNNSQCEREVRQISVPSFQPIRHDGFQDEEQIHQLTLGDLRAVASEIGYQELSQDLINHVLSFINPTLYSLPNFPVIVEVFLNSGNAVSYLPHPRQKQYRIFHFNVLSSITALQSCFRQPWDQPLASYNLSSVLTSVDRSLISPCSPLSEKRALERQLLVLNRELAEIAVEHDDLTYRLAQLNDQQELPSINNSSNNNNPYLNISDGDVSPSAVFASTDSMSCIVNQYRMVNKPSGVMVHPASVCSMREENARLKKELSSLLQAQPTRCQSPSRNNYSINNFVRDNRQMMSTEGQTRPSLRNAKAGSRDGRNTDADDDCSAGRGPGSEDRLISSGINNNINNNIINNKYLDDEKYSCPKFQASPLAQPTISDPRIIRNENERLPDNHNSNDPKYLNYCSQLYVADRNNSKILVSLKSPSGSTYPNDADGNSDHADVRQDINCPISLEAVDHASSTGVDSFVCSSVDSGRQHARSRLRGNRCIFSFGDLSDRNVFTMFWNFKSVNQVGLGKGFIVVYDDSSVAWHNISSLLEQKLKSQNLTNLAPYILNRLPEPSPDDALLGRSVPKIKYVVLGSESNFYVKFEDGRMEWCGPDAFGDALRKGVNEERNLVERVAFGPGGGWFVLWNNGTYCCDSLPLSLEDRLIHRLQDAQRVNKDDNNSRQMGQRTRQTGLSPKQAGLSPRGTNSRDIGVTDLTIGPNGEWFVFYRDHSVQADNLPDELFRSLSNIRETKGRVRSLVFGDRKVWVARYWYNDQPTETR